MYRLIFVSLALGASTLLAVPTDLSSVAEHQPPPNSPPVRLESTIRYTTSHSFGALSGVQRGSLRLERLFIGVDGMSSGDDGKCEH
jgi:hypothetical protein